MRGASAIEEVLKDAAGNKATPLIIWEPILRTDFSAPGRTALGRISDPRAAQYWDPNHVFARELRDKLVADSQHPQPSCCDTETTPWDLILVYPPGARWETALPRATYADGPVYRLKAQIRKAIAEASSTAPKH